MDTVTIERIYQAFLSCSGVCTDSRKVTGGDMFFALQGPNFDGNAFALQALEKGAACAVVSSGAGLPQDERLLPVEDTLRALQEVARWHRSQFRIPVIGLTGTNGKTTTKELVSAALAAKFEVVATQGNLNNHIGVPLTLLRLRPTTQVAVIEMGADHPGEIAALADIALPNYGLITNVGKGHLEGFGSLQGVMRAKGELYDSLGRTADTAFVNADDPLLCEMAALRPEMKVVPYGMDLSAVSLVPMTAQCPYLRLRVTEGALPGGEICTHLVGGYNAPNVLAALCVAMYFGVDAVSAVRAIEAYRPSNLRSQLERTDRNVLILDTYNANPSSMEASLKNFEGSEFEHKVLILGDMLELGKESAREHERILARVADMACEKAFFVGEEFSRAGQSVQTDRDFTFLPRVSDLYELLRDKPLDGCTVLIKGSHGIGLPVLKEVL